MSDHESSNSTRSSPASDASSVLTPRRKVQALLAQFSDSESEDGDRSPLKSIKHKVLNKVSKKSEDSHEESEDELVSRPSRMAARLAGGAQNSTIAEARLSSIKTDDKIEKSRSTILPALSADVQRLSNFDSSEDELVSAAAHRRVTTKRKSSPVQHTESPKKVSRSDSPLFFSSPASSTRSVPLATTQSVPLDKTAEEGRARFLALVEKRRQERIAREAAEVAREAAGIYQSSPEKPKKSKKRVQRGSSPADNSDEDDGSDDSSAARRISNQARPTRKASKKALEEMNRETQRMSRNMQLAHQARTKKKITKESFLNLFNRNPSAVVTTDSAPTQRPSSSRSATPSSAGSAKEHITPPTSPIQAPQSTKTADPVEIDLDAFEMHGALSIKDTLEQAPHELIRESLKRGQEMLQNYIKYNCTVFSPKPKVREPLVDPEALPPQHRSINHVYSARVSLARQFVSTAVESGSDSEIEIIADRGSKRKYAVFESLPKRKAQETSSHAALRSLAHLTARSEKKQFMNAVEMEFSLQRKARAQALQERLQKVEELKAKGIIIQTAEEREQDQQEVENLLDRARLEGADIQRREKELAKKDGTYVRDDLDDDDDEDYSDDDEETVADIGDEGLVEEEEDDDSEDEDDEEKSATGGLIDDEVDEAGSEEEVDDEEEEEGHTSGIDEAPAEMATVSSMPRVSRKALVISDDEEEESSSTEKEVKESPELPPPAKTPQSVLRSARKVIPGLQMSDDLPMGLSQAFAATMAGSQSQDFEETQAEDSMDLTAGLPAVALAPAASMRRFDSVDMISDSQPASQTQPLDVHLSFTQTETVPESPARGLGISGTQYTPSHAAFDLTQDGGYILSPFKGSRFEETPGRNPSQATVGTVMLPSIAEDSPIKQRHGRLRRGRIVEDEDDGSDTQVDTAFQVMQKAARKKIIESAFEKSKSNARGHFDEAAEESEDEYAGLGGASDDDGDDVENEDDRRMIDEDVQVGRGEEAKLAGLYADRERERDEKEVSKLLKDITTGALRRKRGVGDELDLSDEEDEAARRRESKRREFARMRRELLKDEAVGKIAEDKKKEAFLRSIEDREAVEDDDDDFDQTETQEEESQEQSQQKKAESNNISGNGAHHEQNRKQPLDTTSDSQLNKLPSALRRNNTSHHHKPATLAEIRDSVSFLIDEPDSQAATVDLGLSDSEDEPEAYVNLDRHLKEAENNENDLDDDAEDLGDFVVDDESTNDQSDPFKKPYMPQRDRAPFHERRTPRTDVVDRLSLSRQSSSNVSTGSNNSSKMAFFISRSGSDLTGVPSLLRRATTNSSIGFMNGRDNVSATGVTTSKPERGNVSEEKEFVRKGSNGKRNAVNYQARTTLKEEKMSERAGIAKKGQKKGVKGGKGFLGGLFRGDSWE